MKRLGVLGCAAALTVACSCSGGSKHPPASSATPQAEALDACHKLETFAQLTLAAKKVDAPSLTAAVKAATQLRNLPAPYATLGNDIIASLQATDQGDTVGISRYGAKVQTECTAVANQPPG